MNVRWGWFAVAMLTACTPESRERWTIEPGATTSQSPLAAVQEVELYNFDPDVDFGRSVALDGDLAVVGAPRDDEAGSQRSGAVYVLRRDGTSGLWSVVATLAASDAAAYDCFGRSVDISGDTIVVGGQCRTTATGVAYVFDRGAGDDWTESAILTAGDPLTYDRFGRSVAIWGDYVAVGAPGYDERKICYGASCPDRPGSVYVFERDADGPGAWGQVKKLQASGAANKDQFGFSVSLEGLLLAVGAQGLSGFDGAVYLFDRDAGGAGTWTEVKAIAAPNGDLGCFGGATSLSGDLLAAGSPCEDSAGYFSGAAYVFARDQDGADQWGLLKRVTGSGIDDGDQFGDAIVIVGDDLFVGATFAGIVGSTAGEGRVHHFERDRDGTDAWGEAVVIAGTPSASGDEFGVTLASDGAELLIGIPGGDEFGSDSGVVQVSGRDVDGAGAWGAVSRLAAPTPAATSTWRGEFGRGLAADGDWLAVGAMFDNFVASGAGSAMLFHRNAQGAEAWGPVAKLLPPSTASNQYFGYALGLSGNTLVVGGYLTGGTGQAVVYELDIASRPAVTASKTLVGSDAPGNAWFGLSVSISGDTVVIGATGRYGAGTTGAAYIFERDAGGAGEWGETKKLLASDGAVTDNFGHGVAIDGNRIVVGAPGADHGAFTDPGAAYIFERDADGPGAWGEVKKLIASDPSDYQDYGGSVALQGDIVVIGATDSAFQGLERMQTYLYGRDVDGAGAWGEIRKLEDSDTTATDQAGYTVDIDGDVVVVGAPNTGGFTSHTGAVYVFMRNAGGDDNWGLAHKFAATNTDAGDYFARGLALVGNQVFVGAPDKEAGTQTTDVGRAYVFTLEGSLCLPSPCLNGGSCSEDGGSFLCSCVTGYDGSICEIDIDECAGAPCQNGGTCTDGIGSYSCACLGGYTGDDCEIDIDECAASPCQNGGVCSDGVNSYSCACVDGYTGDDCEIDIDDCAASPCQNGGSCIDGVNSYACSCVTGYTGDDCEIEIDECAGSPCQNGGTCTDGIGSYTCSCAAGYTGDDCEIDIDDCAVTPCQNGGTCVDGVNSYTCSCAAGYTGTHCETDIDDCAANPCQNGGTCSDGVASYACTCLDGYTGDDCEIDVDSCAAMPCLNGGTCTDALDGYQCTCPSGFEGVHCESSVDVGIPSSHAGCACRTTEGPGLAMLLLSLAGLVARRRRG